MNEPSDTPGTDAVTRDVQMPPQALITSAIELDNWFRVRGSDEWECSSVASRRTVNRLQRELATATAGQDFIPRADYDRLMDWLAANSTFCRSLIILPNIRLEPGDGLRDALRKAMEARP